MSNLRQDFMGLSDCSKFKLWKYR